MIRRAVMYVSDLVNCSRKACPTITLNRARGFSEILVVLKTHGYIKDFTEDVRKHVVELGPLNGYYRKGWTHGLAMSKKQLDSWYRKLYVRHEGIFLITSPKGLKIYEPRDNTGGIPLVYVY